MIITLGVYDKQAKIKKSLSVVHKAHSFPACSSLMQIMSPQIPMTKSSATTSHALASLAAISWPGAMMARNQSAAMYMAGSPSVTVTSPRINRAMLRAALVEALLMLDDQDSELSCE
jgi:hypothetical protein